MLLISRQIFSCFQPRNPALNLSFFLKIRSFSQYSMPPKTKAKGAKRAKESSGDEEAKPGKKSKKNIEEDSGESSGSEHLDLTQDCLERGDKQSNFKISSWNVNGVRAWTQLVQQWHRDTSYSPLRDKLLRELHRAFSNRLDKPGQTVQKCKPSSYVTREKPDILCVQEIKCVEKDVPKEAKFSGYHMYLNSADQKGYAGVGIFSKKEPLKVENGIGIKEHDNEGRVITAEYKDFYLVNAYVPNSGRGLPRLEYRQQWDKDFMAYLKKLDKTKPVILCGDLNVAHKEIDLANPGSNKRTAGFTIEERSGFSKLLGEGFTDTFREFYPDKKGAYSFWTYMRNARAKNVGWRLDYFVVSKRLVPKVCDSVIRSRVQGSDHCPIGLLLAL